MLSARPGHVQRIDDISESSASLFVASVGSFVQMLQYTMIQVHLSRIMYNVSSLLQYVLMHNASRNLAMSNGSCNATNCCG